MLKKSNFCSCCFVEISLIIELKYKCTFGDKIMKNKKCFVFLALLVCFPILSGCGANNQSSTTGKSGSSHQEDPNKVTIKVGNLNTGYGTDYLTKAIERYEELHKNDTYGDKVGVKINIDPTTDSTYPKDSSSIISDDIDIHFRENMNVESFIKAESLMDLSDIVKQTSSYDNKKIFDKISSDDKDLYTSNGKIYALPFYSGSYGIIYNKKLFKDNSFYISKDTPLDATSIDEVKFTKRDSSKSTGYDGEKDTYDDGLPRTYVEFSALLKTILQKGSCIPIGWTTRYAQQYVTSMMVSAFSSTLGYEEAKLRYSFDGTATSLGKVTEKGFVKDLNSTVITNGKTGNGYKMMSSKGYFDALTFFKNIVTPQKDGSIFYVPTNSERTHLQMQQYMVDGYIDSKGDPKNVAMCIDGTWFFNELCKDKTAQEKQALNKLEFGFMPLPKQTFNNVKDRKYVFTETARSCAFIKGNITDEYKKQVALDFLKFFYSDGELINFAKETKCVIGVKYPELDKKGEDYLALGSFGQDVYEMTSSSNRININFPNQFYLNNRSELSGEFFFRTKDHPNPYESLLGSVTVNEYFNSIGSYYSKEKWSQLS